MVMDSITLPETLELADGGRMEIRPTTAADADRICAVYESLSDDDRRRRFFSAFHPQREWCREWADLGARGGFGVIAIVRRADAADEVAGEAGYAMRADGDGDLAVTVTSRWRGWLGAYLLDVLVRHAGEVGVRNLQAEVLLDNAAMLSLLQRRDPVAMAHDSAMVRLSIGTTGATPTWPPADERRRVLIEVAGRRWSGEEAADLAGLSTVMCAGPAPSPAPSYELKWVLARTPWTRVVSSYARQRARGFPTGSHPAAMPWCSLCAARWPPPLHLAPPGL